MILAKTGLKKIPNKCQNCTFSAVRHDADKNSHRYCVITREYTPYEYIKERYNWCYVKPENCPLIDENALLGNMYVLPWNTIEDNDCRHCKHEFYSSMGGWEFGYCEIRKSDSKFIGCKYKESKENE